MASEKTLNFDNGFNVDLLQAWIKLISRQFAGNSSRAASELIQNSIDSYPSTVKFEDRKILVNSTQYSFSVTDHGEGLNFEKVKLLVTLGGSDKTEDQIGKFGIGFFSIFNPRLFTERVLVRTKCEDRCIEIEFTVRSNKLPVIKIREIAKIRGYSTCVEVFFGDASSSKNCIDHSIKRLKRFPCLSYVNNVRIESIWDKRKRNPQSFFEIDGCTGFINENHYDDMVQIHCKFEPVIDLTVPALSTGGRNMTGDIKDHALKEMPFLPGVGMVINCDYLSLTISRDSFYLDYNYIRMLNTVRTVLMDLLVKEILASKPFDFVVANQFIFQNKIREYLDKKRNGEDVSGFHKAIISLAEIKVFSIEGRNKMFSLMDILEQKTPDWPLYFTVDQSNNRWLGGEFKHDFIVMLSRFRHCLSDNFFDQYFQGIFRDVVNLDTIQSDRYKLNDLIKRDIINKDSLNIKVHFVGFKSLNPAQHDMLSEIETLLNNKEIKSSIENNLQIKVERILPVFFEINGQKAYLSTGMFTEDGIPVSEHIISNLSDQKEGEDYIPGMPKTIMLGLHLNNPYIRYLVDAKDQYKAYYALIYIANQLTMCQKRLVPYSPLYHLTKERISSGIRKALVSQLLEEYMN